MSIATPAFAAAQPSAVGYVLAGNHNGSTSVSLPRATRFDIRIQRPRGRDRYTAFEITTSAQPAFVYYALVRGDGSVMTGQANAGSAAAGGGFPLGSGPRSGTIDVGRVTLPRGRYRLTLVTHQPSTIRLIPASGPVRTVRLAANHRTSASDAAATYRDPSATAYEARTLPLRVPAHAHVALLFADETWTGTSTVSYVNACLGSITDDPGCSADPMALAEAVQPAIDPGNHGAAFEGIWTTPQAGTTTVTFYSTVSGTVTGQSFIAIALP